MFDFVKGTSSIDNIFHISHVDLIDLGFGIYFFLQVKYCSWFKTKMEFSLTSISVVVGVWMSKNENQAGIYFHNNKEDQKLVKISISQK